LREIAGQQAELLAGQRAGYLDPPALQRGRAWIAHLRRTIALRYVQRAEMVNQLKQLQAAWQAARTQARVIQKLRERRWAEYQHDRARQEQAAVDELAQQLPKGDWL
jgi:flagellar export protein FliJ